MDLIVDIQFFKDKNNVSVPKEVAVTSLKGDHSGHWIVLPQSHIDTLTADIRRTNDWLTRHHHGIDYFEGETSLRALYKTLRELAKNARRIFVRGNEKWLTLHKITTRDIINLEYDKDCPSFTDLLGIDKYCLYHAVKESHLKYSCALDNVQRLRTWMHSRGYQIYCEQDTEFSFRPPIQLCDGQSGGFKKIETYTSAYSGCVPSRSDPTGVDETDSVCIQY